MSGVSTTTVSSHQDPGFIDHIANKTSDVVRIHLPPDANCFLSVADHCLRSRNYINLIIAGKQPEWQWLDIECGPRIAPPAPAFGNGRATTGDPDVVMAGRGYPYPGNSRGGHPVPELVPDIRVRVVNVVDLMGLQTESEHPHGMRK